MFEFLEKIIFSDLFLPERQEDFVFKEFSDSKEHIPLPKEYLKHAAMLREALENHFLTVAQGNPDFTYGTNDKVYRVVRINKGNSRVFVLRHFAKLPDSLAGLGHAKAITEKLLQQTKDGLVLLIGPKGSGKTTSAVAFIHEYLVRHGGTCWTIENPIEIPFEGLHGVGRVWQTEINNDDLFDSSIEQLFRASCDVLFIGEIRNAKVIRKAIDAGKRGMLVVATYHANDIMAGIENFSESAGPDYNLSEVLRAVLYLNLEHRNNSSLNSRFLTTKPFFVDNDGIRSKLRTRQYTLLASEIESQKRLLLNSRA